MSGRAMPLTDENRPKGACPPDCPNYGDGAGHCEDHIQMERSRAVGAAFFKFAGFSIPVVLLVLVGVLSFLSQRVDSVEGKVTTHIEGSNNKLDAIHHSVMTIEFNLKKDFEDRGEEFTELKYKEEY